ncbi:MAG: ATP synthase F1 subunit gamma [Oscillospiraceae bacterium]|nr:ATP synthase F1 subunit gamma [Oscillospiraceae bacterium]
MASGNMKDIKRRIKSVGSTRQITKAMELVSSSKLRKAKTRAEQGRPYFEELYRSMCEIASANTDFSTVFTQKREVKHRLFIVIAGDRGLAGGYNSNLLKLAAAAHENDAEKPKIIAIGRKAIEYFTKRGYELAGSFANIAEDIKPSKVYDIANIAIDMFKRGEVDDVQLFYTTFVSSLTQEPQQMAVLPMQTQKLDNYGTMCYDPSPEAVFNRIVPRFTASLLQCAIVESFASEQGARRTAMESATDNADEMIASLSLLYNRARQASITQELTEIVGGANALE